VQVYSIVEECDARKINSNATVWNIKNKNLEATPDTIETVSVLPLGS